MSGANQGEPPSLRLSISVVAELDSVRTLCAVLRSVAAEMTRSEEVLLALETAAAEAATNIIKHGYAGGDKNAYIELLIEAWPGRMRTTFRDTAPHYHPPAADIPPPEDLVQQASDTSLGLGWSLINQLVECVRYRPLPTGNELELEKRWQEGT